MEDETWKDIEGFEGLYRISSKGRVYSCRYERYMKYSLNKRGYPILELRRNGKAYPCKIHRLVAKAFIENPKNLPQVNHIDGVKTNSEASNLEWCTPKENIQHAFRLGLRDNHGEGSSQAKLTEQQVRDLRLKYNGKYLTRALKKRLGRKYGVHFTTIYSAIVGHTWTHI